MSHHQKPVKPAPPNDKVYLSSGLVDLSSGGGSKGKGNLLNKIRRQPLVHRLDCLVPSTRAGPSLDHLPTELADIIHGHIFQHARLNLADLLEPSFMTTYVRRGSLVALSCFDTPSDDVVAMDGSGRLVLSLCKDTYASLGLTGAKSKYGPEGRRYHVEVYLRQDYMRDGKSGYERLKACLSRLGTVDMLFVFCEEGKAKTEPIKFPASISSKPLKARVDIKYSSALDPDPADHLLDEQSPRYAQSRKRKRNPLNIDGSLDLLASIGRSALSATNEAAEDDRLLAIGSKALHISVQGLLHPRAVADIILKARSCFNDAYVQAFTAHTFPYSPVTRSLSHPTLQINAKTGEPSRKVGIDERDTQSNALNGWTLVLRRQKTVEADSRSAMDEYLFSECS